MVGTEISLTQGFLAEMLGVRRTSVTIVAMLLQRAGLIEYGRGHVRLLDLDGLGDSTCECYATIKAYGSAPLTATKA